MTEPTERVWCIALLPNGMPCHKPLRDAESKVRRIGPKCWRRMTTPIGRVRQAMPAVPPPRVRHSADGVDQLDLLAELAEVSG
jgi:hypothetical protein